MRHAGLAFAAALGALVSGCGGGDSGSKPDAGRVPGAVEARDFDFSPVESRVAVGDPVRWENTGEQIHNVKGKGFFSRAMDPGDVYRFAFKRAGTFEYVCTLHPQMRGSIVVG